MRKKIEIELLNHTSGAREIRGLNGENGKDGETPSDERIIALIEPRIPKLKQPKDGKSPTKSEIKEIIKEVLPEDKLIEKIVQKVPKIKGDKGDKGDVFRFADLTPYEKQVLTGPQGSNGVGVPRYGTEGQVLAKRSSKDFDTEWITGGGGGAVDSVNGQTGVVVLDADDIDETASRIWFTTAEETKLGGIETGAEVNTIDTVSDTTEIDLAITARDLTATIRSGSIDETKLDTSVNASLDLADTAVQPAGLSGYELLANKATDFTTINNTLYPTVQAVNTAINTAVTGLLDYRGSYDASTNLFPATGGSGILGAILSGDFWICSVAGTLGGTPVTPGDLIIAIVDTPGQTASNWDLIENTLGYTPENAANKENTTIDTNTTKYPTVNLLKTGLDTKQPLDTQLTSVAGLSYASNALKVIRVNAGETDFELATITSGGGDVSKVGTPVNNQIGVWTGDGTIEGDTALTWNQSTKSLSVLGGADYLYLGAENSWAQIQGIDATTANASGGELYIQGGAGNGSGDGGGVLWQAGGAGVTGNGGYVQIVAGNGGATSGNGGAMDIFAGYASGGNGNGGNVTLKPGYKNGSGTKGYVRLVEPTNGINAILDTSLISTSDKTFTFPNTTGTFALTANKLSAFAATTSSELAGVISDETGTGALVFATSPSLVTPALGTPSALVATNATGTATGLTSGITNALKSATTTVDVSAATAPSAGQVLTATSSTAATWQTPTVGYSSTTVNPVMCDAYDTNNTLILSTNTTFIVNKYTINANITVTKISYVVDTVTASGTIKLGIYNSAGTLLVQGTSGTISSANVFNTTTLSSTALTPGEYYIGAISVSTTNIKLAGQTTLAGFYGIVGPSGVNADGGQYTTTAGTLPSSITFGSLASTSSGGLFRLDA